MRKTLNDCSIIQTNVNAMSATTIRTLNFCDFCTSSGSSVAERTLASQSPWNGGASYIKIKKERDTKKKRK